MPSFWLSDIYKSGKHETQLSFILGWIFFFGRWREFSLMRNIQHIRRKHERQHNFVNGNVKFLCSFALWNSRQQEILQSLNCSIHYLSVIFCNSTASLAAIHWIHESQRDVFFRIASKIYSISRLLNVVTLLTSENRRICRRSRSTFIL